MSVHHNLLWREKHHAQQALDAARKRLSEAQKGFAKAQKSFQRARARWLDAVEAPVGGPLAARMVDVREEDS